ncbi:MAG: ABC transporter substrate-binding protein [Lachnospiraceae bacterium]|nr:ABC transporter substrate-binding protein [Lachnospiraceae bacterium]
MAGRKNIVILCCLFFLGLPGLYSCGSSGSISNTEAAIETASIEITESTTADEIIVDRDSTGLVYESSMELQYAQNFSVDYYEGGYTLLTIKDGTKILVVPEKERIPENLEDDIIVLKRPIENLYLVASAVMDMFCELDALDAIALSGQKEDGWYIDAAKKAMADGSMLYAGKYNKPDYELIVSQNCSLAIENMMISHSPEVIEKLEDFGVPVMIEYSSYESHPLGRVEWIKFFGALVGKEEKAEEAFNKQTAILEQVTSDEKTDKTVAFFFITSNGLVQVRQSSDYVPKMIALAGGRYIFDHLGDPQSNRSTMNMQVEEFYKGAKDADFIIYNSSIDGGVASIEQLLDKCELLEDFNAVQDGNVFCTTNDMYQQSMSIGYLVEDIYTMLHGKGEENMRYLFRLEQEGQDAVE